jgi:hypothetical protein
VTFRALLAFVTAALLVLAHALFAQSEPERALERRVKAAFLYRFTEFVTWPDGAFARPDSPFVIVVTGAEGMAEELRAIAATRAVAGRAVEVKRAADIDPAAAAHLVFIADSEKGRLRDLLRLAPRHALIVTESEGALAQGSVINFVIVEGRVRFEIALDSAEKRGLRLSSRLLAIAQTVRGTPP